MDEWVSRSRVEPTRDLIEEKKDKVADKEHEGMFIIFHLKLWNYFFQKNFLTHSLTYHY